MCKNQLPTLSVDVLAQKEYKRRYDCVAKALFWDILRQKGFDVSTKWYEHKPDCVVKMRQQNSGTFPHKRIGKLVHEGRIL